MWFRHSCSPEDESHRLCWFTVLCFSCCCTCCISDLSLVQWWYVTVYLLKYCNLSAVMRYLCWVFPFCASLYFYSTTFIWHLKLLFIFKKKHTIWRSTTLLMYPAVHKVSKVGSILTNSNNEILLHVFISDKNRIT